MALDHSASPTVNSESCSAMVALTICGLTTSLASTSKVVVSVMASSTVATLVISTVEALISVLASSEATIAAVPLACASSSGTAISTLSIVDVTIADGADPLSGYEISAATREGMGSYPCFSLSCRYCFLS